MSLNGSGVWLEREERSRDAIHLTALAIHHVRQRAASFNNNLSKGMEKELVKFLNYYRRQLQLNQSMAFMPAKGIVASYFADSSGQTETRAVRQNEQTEEFNCNYCKDHQKILMVPPVDSKFIPTWADCPYCN